jgi:protease I
MKLTGKTIAILVAEGVEDLEYYVPLMRLQEEGATVLTAAVEIKSVRGKNGLVVTPDTAVESLNPDTLAGLVIPGGWAPDKLRRYPAVTDLVREMDEAGKPIGIICHGGLVAISADIVKGHRATGSRGIKDDLVNAGATWVDEPPFETGTRCGGELLRISPHFAGSWFQNLQNKKWFGTVTLLYPVHPW